MSQYFPLYKRSGRNIKVELNLSNHATKADLASLKTKVDKLDTDKLVPVPNDLAKLSNVVKNDVVKKLSMMD